MLARAIALPAMFTVLLWTMCVFSEDGDEDDLGFTEEELAELMAAQTAHNIETFLNAESASCPIVPIAVQFSASLRVCFLVSYMWLHG